MQLIILIGGLVACATAITLVARAVGTSRLRTSQTLGQIEDYGYVVPTASPVVSEQPGLLTSLLNRVAAALGERYGDRADGSKLKAELMAAAMYDTSVAKLVGYRLLGAVVLGGLWMYIGIVGNLPPILTAAGAVLLVAIGWFGPLVVVRRRARFRFERIEREMPDLMDLLVVTVEAGLSFNSSLKIASERMEGPLGDELRLTLQEQSLGLSAEEALRNMLTRCDTVGIRSFVRAILQGETLGVSIGQIMRNLAHEVRAQRKAAAEERAQKAPVKMLFPLIFLIFPAMFVVLLAPAMFEFVQAFGKAR